MGLFGRYKIVRVNKTDAGIIKHIKKTDVAHMTPMEIQNIMREIEKSNKDIDKGIDEITGTDYRVMTIQDWLNAMRTADQPWEGGYRSNWVLLFDIFSNLIQDPHVQACVETLMDGVQSKDFYIADSAGKKLNETTTLFQSKWFFDYLEAIVNSNLWGFSLVQLDNYDDDEKKITVREVNRKHVRFDLGGIVKQQYDVKAWREWGKNPYKNWNVPLWSSKLGKLNACVRWWIYKTEIARIWAKYNNLMGIPPVIAKTKLNDTTRKTNAVKMLKNWLNSRWMVIDESDSVEGFAKGGSDSQQFFENLMRFADEQISKGLLGSTMVLDNGSSRSQSETHEANTAKVIGSLCRVSKYSIDDDLMPRLREIGFPIPQDAKFVWDNSEKLNMKERAEVLDLLNRSYDVEENTASEFAGIALTKKEIPDPLDNNPISGAIKDYKNRLKNG